MSIAAPVDPFSAPGTPAPDGRRVGVLLSHGFTGSPASMRPWGDSSRISVGTPGAVRMLELAHREHGKLPWASLLQPAIQLAEQGFKVSPRLHTLLRRVAGRAVNVIEHGPLRYDPSSCEATLAGQPVDLSRREQALLQALLQNPGRVLSSEQLKDCVYGFSDEVESNALNVHIHHLRRKLGNGIVETVRGLGYRLGPAQAPEQAAS